MLSTPRRVVTLLPLLLALSGLVALAMSMSGGAVRVALLGELPLSATRVEGRDFPKRLIDPSGLVQTIPQPPRRVVSAVLAGDQILPVLIPFARLAAVTWFIDDPGISNIAGVVPKSIPRIRAEIETLLTLQPDLVVVADYTQATAVRLLVASGIPVVRFHWHNSFRDVMQNIRMLGAAVGAEAQAERLIDEMQQRLDAVEQRVRTQPRPRVLYYGAGGFSVGGHTLLDEMITRAGGTNVVREVRRRGSVRVPLEVALSLAPDVIIMPDWSAFPGIETTQALLRDPVWKHVPAVRRGRVYAIRGAWLTSVSQYAVHGLEALARILHPEGFAS